MVEEKLHTAVEGTEKDRQELSLDIDYLYEQLDEIECDNTATRAKRKDLINRVSRVDKALEK